MVFFVVPKYTKHNTHRSGFSFCHMHATTRTMLDHFTVFVAPIFCGNRMLSAMTLDAVSLSASLCC